MTQSFIMGDNISWWGHLEMAIPQLMNMGLSGVPLKSFYRLSLSLEQDTGDYRYQAGNKERQTCLCALRHHPKPKGNNFQREAAYEEYNDCQQRA